MGGAPGTPGERLSRRLVVKESGCLEWTGATDRSGYGRIMGFDPGAMFTHRLAWELANGPIPDGLNVLHHCDNPPCCQTEPTEGYPDGHLFLGTHADNARDKIAKGRDHNQLKTQCPQGHPYDEANTYMGGSKGRRHHRQCRICNKAAVHRYQASVGRLAQPGLDFGEVPA